MGPARSSMACLLAAVVMAIAGGAALAADVPQVVVTSGTGTAASAPDMATVAAGVESLADTAAAALAANSAAMDEVLSTLSAAGIAPRDVRTADFTVRPVETRGGPDRTEPPAITGYRVANTVRVTVRDPGALGPLLDRLVAAGANRIFSIDFGLSDEVALADEARRAAVADAIRKARLYAEAAGVALGPVIAIDDTGGIHPGPRPTVRAMAADVAVPLATGESTVSATVFVTFAIADR